MALHLSPETPAAVQSALSGVLVLHIAAGSGAVLAAGVAMAARKGSAVHRRAGDLFAAAMVAMAGTAALISGFIPGQPMVLGALVVIYLTVSGWAAGRTPPGTVGAAERWAFRAAVALVLVFLAAAPLAAATGTGSPGMALAFAVAVGLAAAKDFQLIRGGGLRGAPQLRRHIWRISAAAFAATGSFFLGQQKVMPEMVQGNPLLFVLGLAPLAVMPWWLFRTRDRHPLPRRWEGGTARRELA